MYLDSYKFHKANQSDSNLQVQEALAIFVCGIHQAVCVRLKLVSPSVFPLLTQMFWLHKQPVCCFLDECAVAGSNRALWLPDLLLVLCCRLIFSSFSVCVSRIVQFPSSRKLTLTFFVWLLLQQLLYGLVGMTTGLNLGLEIGLHTLKCITHTYRNPHFLCLVAQVLCPLRLHALKMWPAAQSAF